MSTIVTGPDNSINNNSNVSGVVTENLQAFYDPARYYSYPNGGNVMRDLSGNGRDMTFYCLGGSTYSNNPPQPPPFTKVKGGEFTYDGVNDFAYITSGGFYAGTRFTVSAWIKTSSTEKMSILSWCNGGPVNFAASVSNGFMFMDYYTAPWQTIQSSIGGIADGNWHYLVWAVNETNIRMYIDNNEVDDTTLVAPVSPSIRSISGGWGPCAPDSYGPGTSSYFWMWNGQIGVVMVHSKQLTDTEVERHWEIFKPRYDL
jgi:hypothetical protein